MVILTLDTLNSVKRVERKSSIEWWYNEPSRCYRRLDGSYRVSTMKAIGENEGRYGWAIELASFRNDANAMIARYVFTASTN